MSSRRLLWIPRMRQIVITLAVFAAVIALIVYLAKLDAPPPDLLNKNIMDGIERDMGDYVFMNHRLPAKLSDLPKRENYDDDTKDAWGREIIYEVGPDGTVTLRSLGKSGKEGSPDNVVRTFKVANWTLRQMISIEREMGDYMSMNHRLPAKLSDLPARIPFFSFTQDAWGREFIYEVGPDSTVTLLSLGGSGERGSPDNIVSTFKVGNWTNSEMIAIESRIRDYVSMNHRLPAKLSDLPEHDYPYDITKDVWRREFIYEVGPDSTVTLLSLGESGGKGSPDNIVRTFKVGEDEGRVR